MDNSVVDSSVNEITKSVPLFENGCFYSVEMIKDMLPLFDDSTILAMYKTLNKGFIDDYEKEEIDRKLDSLKKREQRILDYNINVMTRDPSGN